MAYTDVPEQASDSSLSLGFNLPQSYETDIAVAKFIEGVEQIRAIEMRASVAHMPESFDPEIEAERAAMMFELKGQVLEMLQRGETDRLEALGFSSNLINLWQMLLSSDGLREKLESPQIFATHSHPEKLNLYKHIAAFRLFAVVNALRNRGLDPMVSVPSLNTIFGIYQAGQFPFSLTPFSFGDVRNELKTRLLGAPSNPFELDRDVTGELDWRGLDLRLFDNLVHELMNANSEAYKGVFALGGADELAKYEGAFSKDRLKAGILEILQGRIGELQNLANEIVRERGGSISSKELLQMVEQRISYRGARALGADERAAKRVARYTGSCLLTSDLRYITGCYQLIELAETSSPGLLLDILNLDNGKDVGFVEDNRTRKRAVIRASNAGLELKLSSTKAIPVTWESIMKLGFVPLGALEILGTMLTMEMQYGSEYDMREKMLEKLGITGYAKAFMMGLQLGKDKTQGSLGIVINWQRAADIKATEETPASQRSIDESIEAPLFLAYTLLGPDRVFRMFNSREPVLSLTYEEFKKRCARALVEDYLAVTMEAKKY